MAVSYTHLDVYKRQSLQQAMDKAYALNVPLVLCGDTLDSKSIIRGEISNRLIQLLGTCPSAYVLVGNHDLLNEKSREHSLNFLRPYCRVIDSMTYEDVYKRQRPHRLSAIAGVVKKC